MPQSDSDDDNTFFVESDDLLTNIAVKNEIENRNTTNKKKKLDCIRTLKIRKAEKNYIKSIESPKGIRLGFCAKLFWKHALKLINRISDPWKGFKINKIKEETVKRYCYNSINDSWYMPILTTVKMESTAFGQGAMRECFRLKKVSSQLINKNWDKASNYVAKRYKSPVENNVYFDDVELQMDAKLWGTEYSRQPGIIRKVDISQMSIIEFLNRPGKPLYHLENFIEGDYKKYNSNSGYVDVENRNTPQAFSHFTFERSGHKLIVVDIQGVGDLYTDPQIHTVVRTDYGDGNLGIRGMALFFQSHICNELCKSIGLEPFELNSSEQTNFRHYSSGSTVAALSDKTNKLRVNSISETLQENEIGRALNEKLNPKDSDISNKSLESISSEHKGLVDLQRFRLQSVDDDHNEEDLREYFNRKKNHQTSQMILGEIHHEIAKMHFCPRNRSAQRQLLSDPGPTDPIDWESLLFHELRAAELEHMESIRTVAYFWGQLEDYDSILHECPPSYRVVSASQCLFYMEECARKLHDRNTMIYLALHYSAQTNSTDVAYSWFDMALQQYDTQATSDPFSTHPLHWIYAEMARLCTVDMPEFPRDLVKAHKLYNEAGRHAGNIGFCRQAERYFDIAESLWDDDETDETVHNG